MADENNAVGKGNDTKGGGVPLAVALLGMAVAGAAGVGGAHLLDKRQMTALQEGDGGLAGQLEARATDDAAPVGARLSALRMLDPLSPERASAVAAEILVSDTAPQALATGALPFFTPGDADTTRKAVTGVAKRLAAENGLTVDEAQLFFANFGADDADVLGDALAEALAAGDGDATMAAALAAGALPDGALERVFLSWADRAEPGLRAAAWQHFAVDTAEGLSEEARRSRLAALIAAAEAPFAHGPAAVMPESALASPELLTNLHQAATREEYWTLQTLRDTDLAAVQDAELTAFIDDLMTFDGYLDYENLYQMTLNYPTPAAFVAGFSAQGIAERDPSRAHRTAIGHVMSADLTTWTEVVAPALARDNATSDSARAGQALIASAWTHALADAGQTGDDANALAEATVAGFIANADAFGAPQALEAIAGLMDSVESYDLDAMLAATATAFAGAGDSDAGALLLERLMREAVNSAAQREAEVFRSAEFSGLSPMLDALEGADRDGAATMARSVAIYAANALGARGVNTPSVYTPMLNDKDSLGDAIKLLLRASERDVDDGLRGIALDALTLLARTMPDTITTGRVALESANLSQLGASIGGESSLAPLLESRADAVAQAGASLTAWRNEMADAALDVSVDSPLALGDAVGDQGGSIWLRLPAADAASAEVTELITAATVAHYIIADAEGAVFDHASGATGAELRLAAPAEANGDAYARLTFESAPSSAAQVTAITAKLLDLEQHDDRSGPMSVLVGDTLVYTFTDRHDEGWLSFTAPQDGDFAMRTFSLGDGVDTRLHAYLPGESEPLVYNDDTDFLASYILMSLSAGDAVEIRVENIDSPGSARLDLTALPPTSDLGAFPTREAARASALDEEFAFRLEEDAIGWLTFTTQAEGDVVIRTDNLSPDADTTLEVYRGDEPFAATENDDYFGLASQVTLNGVSEGETFTVRVQNIGERGRFTLHAELLTSGESLDPFAARGDAPVLTLGEPLTLNSREVGLAQQAGLVRFVAPQEGRYTIRTRDLGPDTDTIMTVRDVASGEEIAYNDDAGDGGLNSQVTLTLSAGQEVDVLISEYNPGLGGRFVLEVTQ